MSLWLTFLRLASKYMHDTLKYTEWIPLLRQTETAIARAMAGGELYVNLNNPGKGK
jgi:hypothetical protein